MKLTSNIQLVLDTIVKEEKGSNPYYDDSQNFAFFSSKYILKIEKLSDEDIENGLIEKTFEDGCDSIYVLYNGINVSEDILSDLFISKDSKIDLIIIRSKRENSFSEDVITELKSMSKNLLDLNAQYDTYISTYHNDVLEKFSLFRDLYSRPLKSVSSLGFRGGKSGGLPHFPR